MTIVPFLNRVNAYILNPIIMLLFAVSFLYFFYGIVKFLRYEVGNKERDVARNAIVWGLVGMFIMFSVKGLINFVLVSFGVNNPVPGYSQVLK